MKKLAIFASGSGTNAENIARLFHAGSGVRVAVVLCNRRQAGVYERMQALGVPVIYLPNSSWDSDPQRIIDTLKPYEPDLLVLAGFMRAVRPEIIDAFGGKMLNIHPSLLPKYGGKGMYGHHVHEAVIAAGEKKSGVTVHYVTAEIDGGEIVMQQEVDITPQDTPTTLEQKIHPIEYDLYPRAIAKVLLQSGEQRGESGEGSVLPGSSDSTDSYDASDSSGNSEPSDNPRPQSSPDEQWAKVLHINNYSDREAEKAQKRVHQATPPPAPGANQAQADRPRKLDALMHPTVRQAAEKGKEIPKSYLWVSILMLIFFSTIPGIIACVFSGSVGSRLSAGDLQGARKASRTAQIWIIVSFVLGVLSATLWVPFTLMF